MSYSNKIRSEAILLREKGFSLNEISTNLSIAKSTTSLWVSRINLTPRAVERLAQKQIMGRHNSVLAKHKNKLKTQKILLETANKSLKSLQFSKDLAKLNCALMWWCEGNKNDSFLRFTNSDPTLIKNFIELLRFAFYLDESKFRVLMHLHGYHNENKQKKFWTQVTKIPPEQFHKSYIKNNTGKNKKEGYPGCIALSYYDVKIANELEAIYNTFTKINKGA